MHLGRSLMALMIALLVFITACSSKKYSDRYREGDNRGQRAALTVEEEKQLTREALKSMAKDYPPAKNPALQAYIEHLGQKIVKANNLHGNPYTYNFTVVDVANVNAFALPAGTIYMTAPIIAMANSEDEIAGVLGHEIAHVTARHTAERMYVAKQEQGKGWALAGAGAAIGGIAGYWIGSKLCQEGDTACRAKYAVYGVGGGGAGALLIHNYGFMKNSREDELESDRAGFKYAVQAGYDKDKVGDFYQKLLAMEKQAKKGQGGGVMGWLADAMSSHPPSAERVRQANELRGTVKTPANRDVNLGPTGKFVEMRQIARAIVEESKRRAEAQPRPAAR